MACRCCSENLFDVNLSYKGKSFTIKVSAATTGLELHHQTLNTIFGVNHTGFVENDVSRIESSTSELTKLLFKGKRIPAQPNELPFEGQPTEKNKKKPLKILVVATNISAIQELSQKRSDPTIRGFEQEKAIIEKRKTNATEKYWADVMVQHKDYKFCRIKACTDQSFGHRSTENTPHAFRAMKLLEKLSTDPGIVAIMKERELVVGTLGEMDPIDDRIMQKTESHGGCLLGYNTNRGLRIDIKLRTDDLSGFRPYPELVSTLIHELSHNWVGDHNLLFWTNYAQMRAEYLCTHARMRNSAVIVRGKKTAELAGLTERALENIYELIMSELVREMSQHGLHPNMIADPIRQRVRELEEETRRTENQGGYHLGGLSMQQKLGSEGKTAGVNVIKGTSARELVLIAAERRAREQEEKEKKNTNR